MSINEITINKIEIINKSFGVYSAEVIPPDAYVCRKDDKQFSRFFYVVNGSIIFDRGTDKELRVKKNEIVFLPNNITYKSEWDTFESGKYISLNFVIDDGYVSLPGKICTVAYDRHGTFLEMFEKLFDVWSKGALGYEIEVLSGVYQVIHQVFCEMTYRKIKSKNNVIYKGIMYLENHYLEDITIKQLADMCHTSEGNFRRLFKKYKKMPPISYRNYLRMKKALMLINSKEYSIAEIASAVNIPDIPYFYKIFKKTYGKTPKELADFIEKE